MHTPNVCVCLCTCACVQVCGVAQTLFPPHHFLFSMVFSNSGVVNVSVKTAHFQLLFAHLYTAQCKFCCVCYCE